MTPAKKTTNAGALIDARIAELADWRGKTMARLRKIINSADKELVEEWKWDTPVWSRGGLVCAIGAFKDHIGVNFFKGASLPDPHGLFNSGLDAKASRSIRIESDDKIDEGALKELVRAAVKQNTASTTKK